MKLYTRFGDEWHYPSEFIRPNDGMVIEAFESITRGLSDPDDQAMACWEFVCREIDYPLTLMGESTDYHLLNAYPTSVGFFGTRYRITLPAEEFFTFPCEILGQKDKKTGRMVGDCDDASILLASLVRNALPSEQVKCIIGNSSGKRDTANHAWVSSNIYGEWVTMETTLNSLPGDAIARAVGIAGISRGESYLPFIEFNDAYENPIIPFVIDRTNELAKLRGIAILWGWPTKCL